MFCRRVEEFLTQHGIAFQARNILEDPAAMNELIRLGVATTPVTVIDGEIVVGFDPKGLAALLGLESAQRGGGEVMAAPEPEDRASLWPIGLAVAGVVACCAGTVLLALAATGAGAAVVRSGPALLGAAAAVVIAGLVWWRRRACACPVVPRAQRPRESRAPGEGAVPERPEPTHVR